MIISHKHKLVFMHIPKCAGTSLRNMLVKADPDCDRQWGWRWMPRHQRYGDSAHMPLIDLAPDVLNHVRDYSVMAMTRKPETRFLSAIRQHFLQHKYRRRLTAAEFLTELDSVRIRYDPAYIHFCPQHFFTHIGNKKLATHIFDLDDPNWSQDMFDFLKEKGFPTDDMELPVSNTSERSDDWTMDGVDMTRFYQLYKRDFELFGYEAPLEERFVLHADVELQRNATFDFSAYDEVNFMNWKFVKR